MAFSSQLSSAVEQSILMGSHGDIPAAEISRILHGLLFMRATAARSATDVATDVVESLDSKLTETTDGVSLAEFGDYLKEIFSAKNLYLSVKGSTLAAEYERLLSETKIITDIRPIFENAEENSVLGYVLMHTLKLSIEGSDSEEDICIALTDGLLSELGLQIERARRKSDTLASSLGKALGDRVREE